jgi:flavorubredoxin
LKLEYDELLSIVAFTFNLRRYYKCLMKPNARSVLTALRKCASEAGAYTRPFLSST